MVGVVQLLGLAKLHIMLSLLTASNSDCVIYYIKKCSKKANTPMESDKECKSASFPLEKSLVLEVVFFTII